MFYSQTFLARKGPLSTVWIAAHLQHRLKKSQYASTDIPSTVQHIMDPGVPIALRMSAHLLLGVVRIYSKKVDYLLNDCNLVRTVLYKVFASVSNNTLPEDARQAPVHTITMPATFDLDALNLGYEIDFNGYEDAHIRSQDEITLADRSPIVVDNYVAIRFDEDIPFSPSNAQPLPDSEARPNEEEFIPQSPSSTRVVDVQNRGPSSHIESHTTSHTSDDNNHIFQDPVTKQTLPPESLRDASNDAVENIPTDMDIDITVHEKDQTPEMIPEIHAETPPTQPARPPTPDACQGGASDGQVHGGQCLPFSYIYI